MHGSKALNMFFFMALYTKRVEEAYIEFKVKTIDCFWQGYPSGRGDNMWVCGVCHGVGEAGKTQCESILLPQTTVHGDVGVLWDLSCQAIEIHCAVNRPGTGHLC